MLALLAMVSLTIERGALFVDPSADRELPCAANAALQQAVSVRLPKVKLKARGTPGTADLSAKISAAPQGFRFEVKRPDGTVAMSRDLYSGCAQLGDMGALILERYLADISWAGREVGLVPESPKPPPGPKPTPPPIIESPLPPGGEGQGEGERLPTPDAKPDDLLSRIGVKPEPTSVVESERGETRPADPEPPKPVVINLPPPQPRPPLVTEIDLALGGGGWLGIPLAPSGAFMLDVAVKLVDRFRAGVFLLGATPVTVNVQLNGVDRGTLSAFTLAGLLNLGACTRGTLQLCGGVLGGPRFTNVSASGDRLYSKSAKWLGLGTLGLWTRLSLDLPARLIVALDLLGATSVPHGSAQVRDIPGGSYETATVDLIATLVLGVRI